MAEVDVPGSVPRDGLVGADDVVLGAVGVGVGNEVQDAVAFFNALGSPAMDRDPLDDMPRESRAEIVELVRIVLGIDDAHAEDVIRSTEPFWDAMERAGGLVDTWGGGEFCYVLPRVLAYVKAGVPQVPGSGV